MINSNKSFIISFFFIVIALFSIATKICTATVLWHQDFDNSPVWQSIPSETNDVGGLQSTHVDAISMWNASSYRVSKQKYDTGGTVLLETSTNADKNGNGKGLIYYFNAVANGDWHAASINLAFNDPDIAWETTIDQSGYQELWLTVWYKTPDDLIWYNPAQDPETPIGFTLWKGCRFWAYSVNDYVTQYNNNNNTTFATTSTGHWLALWDDNARLSSHYLDSDQFYKKPFMIMSWYGQTLFSQPAWLTETDADAGTSGFPSAHDRDNYKTHLVGGEDYWGASTKGNTISGALNDNQWHKVEYHVKLNDLGSSNSIEEVYIDSSATPLHTKANGQTIRTTDRKFQQVILFDNYSKFYGGKQALYIDDITVSTTRLPITRKYILLEEPK